MPSLLRALTRAGLLLSALASPLLAQTDTPPNPPQTGTAPSTPPDGPPRGGPGHRLEHLQRELGLSDAQSTQVKAVLDAEHQQMEALRANATASPQARHDAMMTLHANTDKSLRAVFTPEQTAKYDAMEARMREHQPPHGHDEGGPPPPPDGAGPGL